jgi:5-methylthioribose kinase
MKQKKKVLNKVLSRVGIEQKAIETAKNMLRKKINIETIMEITGLSKEKIEKLR